VPLDAETYEHYFQVYKDEVFWKILNQKEDLNKTISISSKGEKRVAKKHSEAPLTIQSMQANAMNDQLRTVKSEILVLQEEMQQKLIKASIQALEDESAALSKCFEMGTPEVDAHIHPF